MDEQISDEQGAVDPREASKMKRAGQACVTFFVVFLISLLAFGKAPSVWTEGSDGGRLDFNLISSLGVVVGIFAFMFLLVSLKRLLRLPTTLIAG